MELLALLSLKGTAEKLTLESPVEDFVQLLKPFGIEDESLVPKVVAAAKLVSRDPSQTVMEWFQDGGLLRLLAGAKPDEEGEEAVIQCPHCTGIIFV